MSRLSRRLLQLNRLPQCMDLVYREISPAARLEVAQRNGAKANALKLDNGMPNSSTHQADLQLASFVDHNTQPRIASLPPRILYTRRSCLLALDLHTFAQLLKRGLAGPAAYKRAVLLFNGISRVRKAERQLTVVREEQEACAFGVEAPDRVDPCSAFSQPCVLKQVEHGGAAMCVLRGAHHTLRLIQSDVH